MRRRYIQHPVTHELIPAEEYAAPVVAGTIVIGDIKPYVSPVTRKVIDGRRQQREDLAITGCRIADPSEKPSFSRPPPERDVDWKL